MRTNYYMLLLSYIFVDKDRIHGDVVLGPFDHVITTRI